MLLEITNEFSHLFSAQDILSRELLLYYSYIVFLVVSARLWSKDGTSFVSFFLYRLKTFFDISLLLYASTVLITRSFNFLLARIRNDLYYYQFSKISFNYLLSNKLFLKKSYFLIQFQKYYSILKSEYFSQGLYISESSELQQYEVIK